MVEGESLRVTKAFGKSSAFLNPNADGLATSSSWGFHDFCQVRNSRPEPERAQRRAAEGGLRRAISCLPPWFSDEPSLRRSLPLAPSLTHSVLLIRTSNVYPHRRLFLLTHAMYLPLQLSELPQSFTVEAEIIAKEVARDDILALHVTSLADLKKQYPRSGHIGVDDQERPGEGRI